MATNDTTHPLITFTLVADIKRVPEIYRRVQNPDFVNGQRIATFKVFPTGSPFITLEKGERLTIPLRVSRGQLDSHIASVTTEDAARKNGAVAAATMPTTDEPVKQPFPTGAVTYRIRPGRDQRAFWVDVEVAGVDKAGRYWWSGTVADPSTGETFPIELSALVFEENLILNPRTLAPYDVSLEALKEAPITIARLNVRKMIGSIHITSVASTLGFVKVGWQVLINGTNYLVKAYVLPDPGLAPGKYEGIIKINTDDPAHRQIEAPFKVNVIP